MQAGLTPLVGRGEELKVLSSCWAQARDGNGQVVLLSGEAGIGKSRLAQALKDHVEREGAVPIDFRCSPYCLNTPFFPLIQHLGRRLRFAATDSVDSKLSKLREFLAQCRFRRDDTLP